MKNISQALLDVGVPTHTKGFRYLRNAVEMIIADEDIQMTKTMYPAIAELHPPATASRVERAMRHAIGLAFDNMDHETIKQYFGLAASKFNAPSISGFVATVAMHCNGDL